MEVNNIFKIDTLVVVDRHKFKTGQAMSSFVARMYIWSLCKVLGLLSYSHEITRLVEVLVRYVALCPTSFAQFQQELSVPCVQYGFGDYEVK